MNKSEVVRAILLNCGVCEVRDDHERHIAQRIGNDMRVAVAKSFEDGVRAAANFMFAVQSKEFAQFAQLGECDKVQESVLQAAALHREPESDLLAYEVPSTDAINEIKELVDAARKVVEKHDAGQLGRSHDSIAIDTLRLAANVMLKRYCEIKANPSVSNAPPPPPSDYGPMIT